MCTLLFISGLFPQTHTHTHACAYSSPCLSFSVFSSSMFQKSSREIFSLAVVVSWTAGDLCGEEACCEWKKKRKKRKEKKSGSFALTQWTGIWAYSMFICGSVWCWFCGALPQVKVWETEANFFYVHTHTHIFDLWLHTHRLASPLLFMFLSLSTLLTLSSAACFCKSPQKHNTHSLFATAVELGV